MQSIHRPGRVDPWIAALYAVCMALLAGCQLLGPQPTAVESQAELRATDTPVPARMLALLPATYTPAVVAPSPSPTPAPVLPELLAGFPLFEGASLDPAGTLTGPDSAGITIQTSKSPGELDAFYQQALQAAGWTLRYTESNQVGGFVQEWKKEKAYLTVEYHFPDGRPVVNADIRVIDTNQALALLLGFPLPNGTEVVRKVGSSIELYSPQDLKSTVQFFKTQIASFHWRLETIQPTGWCGSRGCQEEIQAKDQPPVALEPLPTADKRKAEYYRATLPDRTQAEISFLPHGDHTRVYVQVNFADLRRSGMPVPAYPKATITGVMPGVAMFEVKADIKDVIKFYEDGLAWLGWEALPFTVNTEEMYTRSWRKDPGRVISLSLSVSKGTVYGQLTCATCADPYYIFPTTTPSPAPSR